MEALEITNPIHRISVVQFHRMVDAGVFAEGERVELIDGEMRDMSPIGPPHTSGTDRLNMLFAVALAGRAIVRVQGALVLDSGTELYPDLTILKPREDWYRRSHPSGDDAWLVVEVADNSLSTDQKVKLPRYARAGVPRYWVVDLNHATLHDYRDPDRFGRRYRQADAITEGAVEVEIDGVEVVVEVAELLGG